MLRSLQTYLELHKFTTTNCYFLKKNSIISDVLVDRLTWMYINFQLDRVTKSVKTMYTNLFTKKIVSCMNLQLASRIFKSNFVSTSTHPQPTSRQNLRSFCPLDSKGLKELKGT